MSALDFSYSLNRTPGSGSEKTMAQFLAATHQRAKLKSVTVMPKGTTAAVVPLRFDLVVQNDGGTSVDDSPAREKQQPAAAETIQTTVRKTFTVEPGTSDRKHMFSVHPQSGGFTFFPPDGPIIIPGGTRLGLRYLATDLLECDYQFHLEE